MHLHFEKNTNTKCDCSIVSLSWMGKVPDDIPETMANSSILFTSDYSVEATFYSITNLTKLIIELNVYGYHEQYIPNDMITVLVNPDFFNREEYQKFSIGERMPNDEDIFFSSKRTEMTRAKQNHSIEFSVEFDNISITYAEIQVNDDGWKLNRTNYYQEGWLATGNIRGIVGVTFTTSHCKKNLDYPVRTNYNLRGHRSDVILVKWNEPYQKLASCDSSGIIFVWIKYEGRWSIELINDRNTPVTHFSWSHDGRMALICYQDGFVLVGSVAGQRYWSSMLNLESTITCGIWTPDDQQVYFGTTQGQIIVMDVHGAMVSQVQLCSDIGITSMAWSCEKFKMEEGEDTEPGVSNAAKRTFVLAVGFKNGFIYLLKSFDDVSPVHINTEMSGSLGFVMEWSNSRELLAVAGSLQQPTQILDSNGAAVFTNLLKFYTDCGILLYATQIPNTNSAVSALTWGHNDKRLFIATGTQVHIAWVSRRVASLQLLCRLEVQACIGSELLLPKLPLPSRLKTLIGSLFAQTIRCCVPNTNSLREFVSRPPACSTRLHCTMIRHDDENNVGSGTCYTLYLEYLGGLVPLLKGKRTSKIRPEFVIFDPQAATNNLFYQYSETSLEIKSSSGSSNSTLANARTDSSDSEPENSVVDSPRHYRKINSTQIKKQNRSNEKLTPNTNETTETPDELAYVDTLPEEVKLVEVTSNIWGTKFKIHGLAKTVPANLGQVTYKTSLLHLQPRQMTLVITELRDDFPMGPDPSFNPNIFSEDEDDHIALPLPVAHRRSNDGPPPIAPMSPRPNRFTSRTKNSQLTKSERRNCLGPLAKAESYEDDNSQSEVTENLIVHTHTPPARPRHIETSGSSNSRSGPSYTSLVTQYSRSSSNCGGQSRHAISPLCCEGSVPTLQSPKNAVGPSDIIFERPPAGQNTIMNYTSNHDYGNSVGPVKNVLFVDATKSNAQHNPIPLNLHLEKDGAKTNKEKTVQKKKEIQFIDDEAPTTSNALTNNESKMHRTPTVIPISPVCTNESITRSCSVGYLDSVEMVPSDVALLILRKDAPNKRLILVDRKPNKKNKKLQENTKKMKLINCGKSKSLDSCDLSQMPLKVNNIESNNVMPKLCESSEAETVANVLSDTNTSTIKKPPQHSYMETSIINSFPNNKTKTTKFCSLCHTNELSIDSSICDYCKEPKPNTTNNNHKHVEIEVKQSFSKPRTKTPSMFDHIFSEPIKASSSKSTKLPSDYDRKLKPNKKNTEVITSYTDSPLFTRKHRFGDDSSDNNRSSPLLGRKFENGFSLINYFSEARKRRKEENLQLSKTNSNIDLQSDEIGIQGEAKASISLHTQALTTLENIISRLRDLDDGRLTPPSSPKINRLPRSSPASPALSKKEKRNQSASPIRHILNSPLLNRRQKKKQQAESSDDESSNGHYVEETSGKHNYRDLETFQKAQLRQKLKRGKIEPNGTPTITKPAPLRREFVMHNKAPMWNENSQVYQLDFGGRVTQESAKNFQIEFRGKQVMQFGRIDGNAYTLDFQYPFSALQAFAVALANVTQRLK